VCCWMCFCVANWAPPRSGLDLAVLPESKLVHSTVSLSGSDVFTVPTTVLTAEFSASVNTWLAVTDGASLTFEMVMVAVSLSDILGDPLSSTLIVSV